MQDWIWQDALKVGNRVYHASCYAEVTKDGSAARAGTPSGRTGTPDSVLGKRKAEVGAVVQVWASRHMLIVYIGYGFTRLKSPDQDGAGMIYLHDLFA